MLWPPGGAATARAGELHQTQYTQPATFVIEYALARLWMSWGVVPQALVGHSVGEYVAACLAGVFTLSDALALIAARGRLVQSLPAGAMLAVFMSEDDLDARLPAGVTIAAVNGRTQCVVAGRTEAVAAFERALVTQGVACKALRTSHAFHSPMMDPILAAFGAELGRVTLRPPAIRCLSNLTGTWLTDRDATDPGYWIRHLRETVRFGDCLETLRDYGASAASVERVLVEVGPGRTLSQLARRAFEGSATPTIVASMRDATDTRTDIAAVMSALGRMWTSGVTVDWDQVHAPYQRPHRVALPTYPFERRRYWIEPATATGNLGPAEAGPHAEGAGSHDIQDVGAGFSRPVVVDGPHPPHGTQFENPTEAGLAGIWRELIGADEIEPGSNFFELGGDSLLLMTLASRIARVFGVTLPMRELFEAPDPGSDGGGRRAPRALGLPAAAARRAGEPRGRAASVVRTAAPLVPRAVRAWDGGLQRARGGAHDRASRRRGARGELRRPHRTSRVAAHEFPRQSMGGRSRRLPRARPSRSSASI